MLLCFAWIKCIKTHKNSGLSDESPLKIYIICILFIEVKL